MPFHKKIVKKAAKVAKAAYKVSPIHGYVKTTKTLRKSAQRARK